MMIDEFLSYAEALQLDEDCFGFYDVKFTKALGPFAKDEEVFCIVFDFMVGTLTATDKSGHLLKQVKVAIHAR